MKHSNHRQRPASFGDKSSPIDRSVQHHARRLVDSHRGFSPDELQDVAAELYIAAHQCQDRFDPHKASFATYLNRVLQNEVASLIRAKEAGKRDWRRETCSLNDQVPDDEQGWVERCQTFESSADRNHTGQSPRDERERVELRDDVNIQLEDAPDLLRRVADLLLEGRSIHAAAQALGLSQRKMSQLVSQLLRLFADYDLRQSGEKSE